MTLYAYQEQLKSIKAGAGIADIHVSPDFQCDQTEGFPASLCVHWKRGKAWLELNENFAMDTNERELGHYRQLCADYGIRDCGDTEDFNALLRQLGADAYENASLPEEEMDESLGMQF